jgi:hypothetical protein
MMISQYHDISHLDCQDTTRRTTRHVQDKTGQEAVKQSKFHQVRMASPDNTLESEQVNGTADTIDIDDRRSMHESNVEYTDNTNVESPSDLSELALALESKATDLDESMQAVLNSLRAASKDISVSAVDYMLTLKKQSKVSLSLSISALYSLFTFLGLGCLCLPCFLLTFFDCVCCVLPDCRSGCS